MDTGRTIWERTYWVLGALVTVPLFLLAFWLLGPVEKLETDVSIASFSVIAVGFSLVTVCWKWLDMRQRTGVCPNIHHSTVCRPYFDTGRQLRFKLLPGFWMAAVSGATTLICVGLTLYLLKELSAGYHFLGISLSLAPIPLYLLCDLRINKDSFRLSTFVSLLLLFTVHVFLLLPDSLPSEDQLTTMFLILLSVCIRNMTIKHSSNDFSCLTTTVLSMFIAGFMGLFYSFFSKIELIWEIGMVYYAVAGVILYAAFAALNFAVVNGSAGVATAICVFCTSLPRVYHVSPWTGLVLFVCFVTGGCGLIYDLTLPHPAVTEEKIQPAAEIDDMEGYYMPLQGGEVVS